jgi:hypothetical protein
MLAQPTTTQELDRNGAIQDRIPREVDLTVGSSAKRTLDQELIQLGRWNE